MLLKKPVFSPARPESAETASLPSDAPYPMLRSPLERILNVAHSENKLSWQLGWAGEKGYASSAFIGCGIAWDKARLGEPGLGG
jgi:hypothetical protein